MNKSDLQTRFPDFVFREQEVLAPHTYMKVGGPADVFVVITEQKDLFALCSFCFQEKIPFLMLGGASNVVVPDEGVHKLVIRNQTGDIHFGAAREGKIAVTVDSGVITALLANKSMEKSLTGLEYFIGVPGTIGGAIVNNSHFSAKELIGNLVRQVDVCTVDGKRETWTSDHLAFDYDYSIFHERGDVILSAVFVLELAHPEMIQEKVKAAALKRTSTQPIGLPSSGCMYRNPQVSAAQFKKISAQLTISDGAYHLREDGKYQIAAGFLIDQAGLKGTRVGGVQVSEKHATYMINTGGATAHDIEALCSQVEATVQSKFGVTLEREVFFLGAL